MKISSVLKVLGAAAAVAALTPYQVEKDEETGVTSMRALLWGAEYTPATGESNRDLNVILGLNVPKLPDRKADGDETDPAAPVAEAAQNIAEAMQEAAAEAKEAIQEVQEAAAEELQEAIEEAQAAAEEVREAIAGEAQAVVSEAARAVDAVQEIVDDDDDDDSDF